MQEAGDRGDIRREPGYGDHPVVVCGVGRTAIGRGLLELCGEAFPLASARIPGLRMLLVCGPRIDPATFRVPPGVGVLGMVPELWRHLAACDLAVVQGGGTTTLELEAMRRPFLYFPMEGHAEQELTVAARLERHRAGRRMPPSSTTADSLATAIVENLDAPVDYEPIPANGAETAARVILDRAT